MEPDEPEPEEEEERELAPSELDLALEPIKEEESGMSPERDAFLTRFYSDMEERVLGITSGAHARPAREEIGEAMHPPFMGRIASLIPPNFLEGGTLIDIGSGMGTVLGFFAFEDLRAARVVGLEIDTDRAEKSDAILSFARDAFRSSVPDLEPVSISVYSGDIREYKRAATKAGGLGDQVQMMSLFGEGTTVVIANNLVFDSVSSDAIREAIETMMKRRSVTRVAMFTTAPVIKI